MSNQFDVIVIGAGQAGPPLAFKFANLGKKVAVIERKLFGGTCVNTGCIPTKTMIASARVAHLARQAKEFGIRIDGNITVDMKKVKARKDGIVHALSNGIEKWLRDTPNCTVYKGHAQFENAHSIRVGDEVLEAEKIFIDVGARAFVPNMKGLEKISYFTNSNIMDIDFIPEHLIIIGGSYIGLEFAQMYRRFGSQVTVIEKSPRLIAKEDPDISEAVREILQAEGIDIRLNARMYPT